MDEKEQQPTVEANEPIETQENPTPEVEAESEPEPQQEEEKGSGMVLGSIIVIVVLVIAAFFIWGNGDETPTTPELPVVELPDGEPGEIPVIEVELDTTTEELTVVSESDELEAIEADLEATNLDELDMELEAIEEALAEEPVL